VQLKNVSCLPLNAHLNLNKPFQLQTEQDGQVYTTSEQVLRQCHFVLCFLQLAASKTGYLLLIYCIARRKQTHPDDAKK